MLKGSGEEEEGDLFLCTWGGYKVDTNCSNGYLHNGRKDHWEKLLDASY